LLDQPIPPEIPNKDIRFHWPTSSAIWHIEPGIIFAQFAGIWTLEEAFEREWPPLAVQTPKQWAFDKVNRLLEDGFIRPGIGRRELSRVLAPLMADDYKRGLVTRASPKSAIYVALRKEWGIWPVQ
jgi:hypothetical protein